MHTLTEQDHVTHEDGPQRRYNSSIRRFVHKIKDWTIGKQVD